MKRSRRRIDWLFYRIYQILDSQDWDFCLKKMRKYRGLNDVDFTIYIDPREDIAFTIIHECLHSIYEEASERRINFLTDQLMRQMTNRQYKNLLNKFIARL